ncbi:MAG: SDR family NAD(P)-dependent oxidoreductase [Acidimicrobiales bacterium]
MTIADRARGLADAVLEVTVVGSFSRLGFAARRALFSWDAAPPIDLRGHVSLVTGATGGLGFSAARMLAALGSEVWIVGRDPARISAAREGLLVAVPNARINSAIADLANLHDVRRCATEVLNSSTRLDVLIHNAGALTHELSRTPDGLELTAQVHVVAPFLLTTQLLPLLRSTTGARVVSVSSGGMYTRRLDIDELDTPPTPFNGVRAYANAKRAQIVLNERWSHHPLGAGITFLAMHPGWAATDGIRTALPGFHRLMGPLLRSADEGADTMVWLAGAPAALLPNGSFWLDRRSRRTSPLPWTRTSDVTAERLWEWCEQRAGTRSQTDAAR